MRPTFGYLMAATWAAQMFGLAYIIVFETEKASYILEATAALSTIWAVGLSVLGIYVYKRSEDKKIFTPSIFKREPKEQNSLREEPQMRHSQKPSEITPDLYMND